MNPLYIIQQLKANLAVYAAQLDHIPDQVVHWKPDPDKWCILEILCHLYDEEREDFRARVRHILETPKEKMPPINPASWVSSRQYLQQDFVAKSKSFLEERQSSIQWLESLDHSNWDNTYPHPKLGPITAQEMLSNWLAHDYIHIRQINRTKYLYLKAHTGFDLDYAGRWL